MNDLEPIIQKLKLKLGEDLLGAEVMPSFMPAESNKIAPNDLIIRVENKAWVKTGEIVRDELNCKWFDFLSAIDWLESPYGRELETEQDGVEPKQPVPIERGLLGGETRLQILARVRSVEEHFGIILKADLLDEAPAIDSWAEVYPGADWNERETWEMFGIRFDGHPGLRHIYLPTEFEGYPLRKDFPLLSRRIKPWPGIVDVELMPGLDEVSEEEG